MQLKRIGISLGAVLFSTIFLFVGFSQTAHAVTPGSILTGFNEALVTRDNTTINFGLFTTANAYDIEIYDTYLKGYAWGEKVGWISLNCANEVSNNCASNNNFHVVNTTSGELSGWAWGQKTGWINFGPFDNNSADTVVINSDGEFDGYAWGQKIGWIKFDCAGATACVKTDWVPSAVCANGADDDGDGAIDYPADTGCTSLSDTSESSGGGGGGGGLIDVCPNIDGPQPVVPVGYNFENGICVAIQQPTYACSNGNDDDGDGLIDMSDPGCSSTTDTDETNDIDVDEYACSDGVDNDGDNLADYPSDPGCIANNDNSEYNVVTDPLTCTQLGNCPQDPTCEELGNCPIDPPPTPTCETNPSLCGEPDIDPPPGPPGGNPPPSDSVFTETIETGFRTITEGFQDIFTKYRNPFEFLAGISVSKFFGALGILTALLSIPIPLWRSLFAFLYRNKRRPWGTVYDSITKQPLDPAYVILKDATGKDIANSITDLDGRYGFLQSLGVYSMIANKTHYEFPSKQLAGKSRDELYDDLYFGEQFNIENDGDVVMKNIPMDPLGFDWNQYAKEQQKRMVYYHRRDVFLTRLSNVLFYVGFIFSAVALIAEVSLFNIVILALYIVLFVLRNTVFKQKAYGSIIDHATTLPIPFAVIRIHFASLGKEVAHTVTDSMGKYYKLIANGVYYVTVEKKNEDGTYTEMFKSEPMDVKNGVINQTFLV